MGILDKLKNNPLLLDTVKAYYFAITDRTPRYNDFYSFDNTFVYKSYGGLHPDKTFCVISEDTVFLGTFELWILMAAKAMYAEEMGFIPVIDFKTNKMKNWSGSFADPNINRWDIHFRQYCNEITVDEVYRSKNVAFYSRPFQWGVWHPFPDITETMHQRFHRIYEKMGLREDKFSKVLNLDKKLPEKTLGITFRRSMENGNKLKIPLFTEWRGHHTRGFVDSYCHWIDDNLERLGYDYFFLATEDRETLVIFKERYGSICLNYDRVLCHYFKDGKAVARNDPEFKAEFKDQDNVAEEQEFAYISETVMLSKCDALLWNPMGQQNMARIIRENDIPVVANNVFLDMYE